MSGFVRAAPWLRQLFTQSRTAQPNPIELSEDVSLIQPYDGGGYPLFDPGQSGLSVDSAAIATGTTAILTVPENSIARVIALSASLQAGVAPTAYALAATPGTFEMAVSIQELLVAGGERHGLPLHCPILVPGQVLRGRHFGGDAATVVRWELLHSVTPLGTVFYI